MSKSKEVLFTTAKPIKCMICSGEHRTYTCPQLLEKTIEARKQLINGKRLCMNCFYTHKTEECKSSFTCKFCNRRHNSALHSESNFYIADETETGKLLDPEEQQALEMEQMLLGHVLPSENLTKSMLPTAMVRIKHNARSMVFSALLDQGSMTNIISKRACEALKLPQVNINMQFSGIGGKETCRVTKRTHFQISPYFMNSVSIGIRVKLQQQ